MQEIDEMKHNAVCPTKRYGLQKLPQHYKFASWRHRYSGRHSDPIVIVTMMKINPAIIETVM